MIGYETVYPKKGLILLAHEVFRFGGGRQNGAHLCQIFQLIAHIVHKGESVDRVGRYGIFWRYAH